MINQCVVVRCFDTDCLQELGAFRSIELISFFLGQALGIFIIFLCAFDHLQRHRGIGRIVFVEVEHPFQTGDKVLRCAVCFFLRIYIDPLDTFTQMEGPGQSAVLGSPIFCNRWNQLTFVVNFQQTVHQIGQVFAVL